MIDTNQINTVLALYLLNKSNKSISEDLLFSLLLELTNINYFEYEELLNQLLKIDCIEKIADNSIIDSNDSFDISHPYIFYNITQNGIKHLNLSQNIIPGLIKLQADQLFEKEKTNILNQSSIRTSFKNMNNQYMVNLSIMDNTDVLMKISVLSGSSSNANHIIQNFRKNNMSIYSQILDILNKDYSND